MKHTIGQDEVQKSEPRKRHCYPAPESTGARTNNLLTKNILKQTRPANRSTTVCRRKKTRVTGSERLALPANPSGLKTVRAKKQRTAGTAEGVRYRDRVSKKNRSCGGSVHGRTIARPTSQSQDVPKSSALHDRYKTHARPVAAKNNKTTKKPTM